MFGKHAIPAWLSALLLLAVCMLPGNRLPEQPVVNADKIFHALAFAWLSFWFAYGWHKAPEGTVLRHHAALIALVFCIAYGGLIEILQELLAQNRSADWLDFLFDAIGAGIGVALFRLKPRNRNS